ncbi:GNAT family N-acetyltransferase [Companilactobacillus huachuanensis]|uniref:GNAT family N-acetyltransferase n=1 Tax=Companilactobacillus huachuanensis TaxID=2559914 RepID=A0ABW1RLP7_9LACO|nr:GNAT family N-acetyltransferase [Companilactobacillus huachuanensis]
MNLKLQEYDGNNITQSMIDGYCLEPNDNIGGPQSIIERSRINPHMQPIMILDNKRLVGCFCLHTDDGPLLFDGDSQTDILLQAFSIDSRFRRRDYALITLLRLSEFVYFNYRKVDRMILGVNPTNIAAQELYLKAGFVDSNKRIHGKFGEIYIYHKNI